MTPEAASAAHARLMDDSVHVRRYTGVGANRPRMDYLARARVVGYQPHMVAGSVLQGDRKVIVLHSDLLAVEFAGPILASDKLLFRGKELAIIAVDDSTRRIGGVLVAYELQVRG
ncbi:hypothetical protein UFOVP1299_52 [uncultured Caudovirales phage]|uniref:Uncharacterized protein n=1 Tax=uncultured Caudovirales phage TaxID=2100421 RepID=A0A6J5RQU3_9CAUD|nr:hypothetical protein UFOVP1299_52 [uncultured Caudovirales phage]